MTIQYTGQTFSLAQDINAGTTYLTIDFTFTSTPPFTEGKVKVNKGEQSEWWVIENLALVSGTTTTYRADVVSRGLKKDATSVTDTSTALQKDHSTTTTCTFVTHSLDWNEKVHEDGDNTWSGDTTITGTWSFTGTTEAGLKLQQVNTTQRNALTGTNTGTALYNTTTDTAQAKDSGGNWDDLPTGDTNPNASETVKGKVKLSTVTNQENADLDTNIVQTQYLKSSSSTLQTDDHGRIVIVDATGKIAYTFLPSKSRKFGGDGSDGVLAGNVTISGSSNSYIVKNYRSITAGSFTMQVTPRNSIIHIKVKGNADLTNWTFDFKGRGGQNGAVPGLGETGGGSPTTSAPVAGTAGNSGTRGVTTTTQLLAASTGGGGGGAVSGGTGGTASAVAMPYATDLGLSLRCIYAGCGGGGAQGGGGYNVDRSGDPSPQPPYLFNGGAGGAGGGCLILEVAGNLTFSSTTVDIRGDDGSAGSNGTSSPSHVQASGGGGSGAGGTFFCIYGGTLSGSPTVNLTAGSAGSGGSAGAGGGFSGGGGAGGSNIYVAGSNGSNGSNNGAGGNGGTGAAGKSFILANTVFS